MAWAYNTPDGTPNNGPTIVAVALSVTALALVALCLRIYVRTRITKAVGLDDWLIIASWIGACGYTSATVVQTKWGLGLIELDTMPDENVLNFGKVLSPLSFLPIVAMNESLNPSRRNISARRSMFLAFGASRPVCSYPTYAWYLGPTDCCPSRLPRLLRWHI